jgi:transcriptional regulator with XRE-family HTH domain
MPHREPVRRVEPSIRDLLAVPLARGTKMYHNVAVLLCGIRGGLVKMPTGSKKPAPEAERMDGSAFARLRQALGRSQRELAELLGVSSKAVESYEQGWRNVPAHVERVLYFLLFKLYADDEGEPCWVTQDCPDQTRSRCVAFIAKEGGYCWFFTGRLCARAELASGGSKGKAGRLGGCYSCPVFSRRLARVRSA